MGYKKRGYTRDLPDDLVRDYRLFAIACEGSKTEPRYFEIFQHLSPRIKVDVIEQHITDNHSLNTADTKSSPKWVLNRAMAYIEKYDLHKDDELWFVIDVDRWKTEQIHELYNYCKDYENWNIAISNPCFEVWLYFHRRDQIPENGLDKCKDFKHSLSKFDKGGYRSINFILNVETAVSNSRSSDTNKDHFFPNINQTKVYLLVEQIIANVSSSHFKKFLEEKIPLLYSKQ